MIKVGNCYQDQTNPPWYDVCKIHAITEDGFVHGVWGVGAMYTSSLTITLEEANIKLASGDWLPWIDPLRN